MLISSLVSREAPTVSAFTARSLLTLAADLQSATIESGENYDLYPTDADTRRLKSIMLDVRTTTVSSDRIRTSQKTMNDPRHSMFSWFFSHNAQLAENTASWREIIIYLRPHMKCLVTVARF
jgi:hypothetical protein